MRSYTERKLPAFAVGLWERAASIVEAIPTYWWKSGDTWTCHPRPEPIATPIELRCHEVTRIVHHVIGPEQFHNAIADGQYGPIEHSWLELGSSGYGGMCPRIILDCYTPARVPQVQLIDAGPLKPESRLYVRGPARDDIQDALVNVVVSWLTHQQAT